MKLSLSSFCWVAFLSLTAAGITATAQADGKSYLHERLLQNTTKEQSFTRTRTQETKKGLFEQKIDHFDASDTRTFKQRYFLNSSYAKSPDAPVIFVMCGEGTCDDGYFGGAADEHARKFGAHLILIEHRYYGQSLPFPDLRTENLKYLSSRQALEDMAAFQKFATEEFKLTGKWIAIGGSYSGALSAFYRLKHPELVIGALASSAPVLAKADFEEYDFHVANAVGPACAAAMRAVVKEAEAALATPSELARVKALFGAQDVRDNRDLLYIIADMGAASVQYGMKDRFCGSLVSATPDKRLAAYAQAGTTAFAMLGMTAFQDSFQFAESINPADYIALGFGARQWLYQSCTEFGFYQVAYHDTAVTVRSTQINREYHDQMCEHLFGIKTPVNTDVTNHDFYEPLLNPTTTAILFTNGANDPWSNLSLSERLGNNTNKNFDYFTIDGGAHCDDLGGGFNPSVQKAKALFSSLISKWLTSGQ